MCRRIDYRLAMNVYRSGDPNQRKPILKPLSATSKQRSDERHIKSTTESSLQTAQPQPPSTSQPGDFDPSRDSVLRISRPSWFKLPAIPVGAVASRSVQIPVWLVAVLALALIAGPVLAVFSHWDSNNATEPVITVAEVVDPTATQEAEEPDLMQLEAESIFDTTPWQRPEPPSVSSREQYLMDSGVNPDLEVRYAADEVERLQAEIEAIQRNSSLLRSLARQQSGDLSAAYSSLELTQEQKDGALEDLQGRIDELEGRIQTVDQLARELRDLLGLPPSDSGIGGPTHSSASDENADPWLVLRADIVAIEQWAGGLVFDLDEVNTEIQLRMAKVEQTGMPRGTSLGSDLEFFDSMPMGWPVEGPITSRFGTRTSPFAGEGGTEMHTGIDIAARTGTPVIATGGGTVQISGDNGGYGLLVVIDHGRGVTSWYGHNSRLLVSPGQRVNAGDVIAEVGSTGRSTGPHVHYEVRQYGVPDDPLPYMQMLR